MQVHDAQTTYAALANHRQPRLDCLAYLWQLVLHQMNVSKLLLLALIYRATSAGVLIGCFSETLPRQ